MRHLFERLFKIRPDELGLVQAFFVHYTCIGMLYTFGATVGDTLFLSTLSAAEVDELLPWVYVGIAGATVAATWIFDRLQGRLPRRLLIVGTQLVLAVSVLIYWLLLPRGGGSASPWLYFSLIIWLEVCALISIVLFFSLAGDYFTSRDAKRVYAYMAGGLPLGNMLAGGAADGMVEIVGTANMLLFVAGLLAIGGALTFFISKLAAPVAGDEGEEDPLAPTRAIVSHRYIQLIFVVALLALACFVLVDFQMKLVARDAYPEAEALASFFGRFYSIVGLAQLVFQFVLVGLLLRRLGVITCLMIMPSFHLVMALLFYGTGYGLLLGHSLLIIATAGFFRMTISETLEMPARELALLPLPPRLRLRAQAMMGGILAPVGQGVGGLLVALLTAAGLQLHELSLVVICCVVLWLLALVRARPRYRETLARSLRNNQLDAVELEELVAGEQAEHDLGSLLASADAQVLLFSLELLRERPLDALAGSVASLVEHEEPEIAAAALDLLASGGDSEHIPVIERALSSDDAQVRAAAVRALCALSGDRAAKERVAWLEDEDPVVRHAAIVGLGRSSGPLGVALIRPVVEGMTRSEEANEREAACGLIAEQGDLELVELLAHLFDDRAEAVRRAAVECAGRLGAVEFLPALIAVAKGESALRREALLALSRMPPSAVEPITAVAAQAELDNALRVQLFHVLAEIGGAEAAKTLWGFLRSKTLSEAASAGRALQQLALADQVVELDEVQWEAVLEELLDKLSLLNRACDELGEAGLEAHQMVRDHQWLELERLFHLFSLRHDPKELNRVRFNLDSPQKVLRANALELLEELLPRRLSLRVVPLLEPLVDRRVPKGGELGAETISALRRQSPWLRVVTGVCTLGGAPEEGSFEMSVDMAWAEELALAPIHSQVADLKKVPLFASVPADDLIPIAREVRDVRLDSDEALFEQGDPGSSMFLVRRGSVRVLVDGHEVAQVGANDVIGEMAVIDGLPRSAECRAISSTELLEISADNFTALVSGHSSAALAVLRTLSSRLRTASTAGAGSRKEPQQIERTSLCQRAGVTCREEGLTELIARCSFLQEVDLFSELPPQDLARIAELSTSLSVFAGEVLFEQGAYGDSMYIIREGSIAVQIDGREVVVQGKRACIGEMALIEGLPRSASCVVVTDAVLLRIGADDFTMLLSTQPDIAVALMRTLSVRLRHMN